MLQYAFRAVQLSLCGVGVGLLWNAIAALAGAVPALDVPAVPPPAVSSEDVPQALYAVIGGRNLFQGREDLAPAETQEVVAPSSLQLRLVGTIPYTEGRSRALIQDLTSGGETLVVKVGQSVANGQAKVVRIEPRRLVMERAGQLEAIEIEEAEGASAAPSRRASSGFNRSGSRPSLQRNLQRGGSSAASFEPPNSPGIRLPQVAPGSQLAAIGLQGGDELLSVDGVAVTDMGQLLLAASQDGPKTLQLRRGGNVQQVTVPAELVVQVFGTLTGLR